MALILRACTSWLDTKVTLDKTNLGLNKDDILVYPDFPSFIRLNEIIGHCTLVANSSQIKWNWNYLVSQQTELAQSETPST